MPSVEYFCQQMKKAQFRLAIGTSEDRLSSGLTLIIPMLKNEGEDTPAGMFCVFEVLNHRARGRGLIE